MIRQLTTQHAELRPSHFNVATKLPRLWHLYFWSLLTSQEKATTAQDKDFFFPHLFFAIAVLLGSSIGSRHHCSLPTHPCRWNGRFAAAALHDARKAKERAYPELLRNSRCRLVVLGIEVGGRWSEEGAAFITNLARTKTRGTPAPLRHAATASRISSWRAFLTHAALSAFAASLRFEDPTHHHNLDGEPPPPSATSSHNSPRPNRPQPPPPSSSLIC